MQISIKIEKLVYILFAFEAFSLIICLTIKGIPNGFGVLWVCLVPAFAMAVFGFFYGSLYSVAVFVVLITLFWTPVGELVNLFDGYTPQFLLRFPFLYLCLHAVAMLVEFVRRVTYQQLNTTEKKYKFLSTHDPLTGLYNRNGMKEKLNKTFNDPERTNGAFIVMDVDNFKVINDTYGHLVGDVVLCKIAEAIRSIMCEHSYYCRWGGEEFLIFMHCEHDPVEISEKVRAAVEDISVDLNTAQVKVTISIGTSITEDIKKTDMHTMISVADKCLYESKINGKNRVTHRNIGVE